MKLFTQFSRVNIVASILALLVGSIGYYFTMRYVLIDQLDDSIRVEEAEILDNIRIRGQLPPPSDYHDQQISYEPANARVQRHYINSTRINHHHHAEPFRELIFSAPVGSRLFTVTVGVSEEETEDLLAVIMAVTAGMILLLLGTLFLANRLLLRRLWKPFYQTLAGMRQFNLSSRQPLPIRDTAIDEFRNLDEVARQMTGQILKDYEMLKGFTDNASH
jgi:uncharacterized protein YneF (UPF0154 family)